MPSVKSYQNRKLEIELLKKEVEALKMTLRLYREYILRAYDPDAADLIAIPSCLKPFDALTYIEEKRYGPNHFTQELS